MVFGKKVAIFDWEWAEFPLEMGRKSPVQLYRISEYPPWDLIFAFNVSINVFLIQKGSEILTLYLIERPFNTFAKQSRPRSG